MPRPARRGVIPQAATSSGSSFDGADATALAAAAEREGVAFIPGGGFFPRGSGGGATSARFAYSYETPERITEGVERVMRLLG